LYLTQVKANEAFENKQMVTDYWFLFIAFPYLITTNGYDMIGHVGANLCVCPRQKPTAGF